MKPKIIFFGSDKYSLAVLNQISSNKKFKLVGVITHFSPCPVEEFAKTLYEVKFTTVREFDKEFISRLKKFKSEVGVLASFGKILPKEVLEIPKYGILNIHPSLLPKYRGPSPVQTAILAGDKVTGFSIIKMDEKMDHGPIIAQFKKEIRPDDTAEALYFKLFEEGARVLLTILPAYLEGKIEPREQDHQKATYTKLLKREDGFIPPEMLGIIAIKPGATSKCKLEPYGLEPTPENLERFIRAMSPWPGAWCWVKIPNKKLKSQKAQRRTESTGVSVPPERFSVLSDQKDHSVKRLKILSAHLENGKLVLDQVQLEGKKPVSFKQFQEGYTNIKLIS